MNDKARTQSNFDDESNYPHTKKPKLSPMTKLYPSNDVTSEDKHDYACHYITQDEEARERVVSDAIHWKLNKRVSYKRHTQRTLDIDGRDIFDTSTSFTCCSPSEADCYRHKVQWNSVNVDNLDIIARDTCVPIYLSPESFRPISYVDCVITGFANVTIKGTVYKSTLMDRQANIGDEALLEKEGFGRSCIYDPPKWFASDNNVDRYLLFEGNQENCQKSYRIPFKVAIQVKVNGESMKDFKRQINTCIKEFGADGYYVIASDFKVEEYSFADEVHCFFLEEKFEEWLNKEATKVAEPNFSL